MEIQGTLQPPQPATIHLSTPTGINDIVFHSAGTERMRVGPDGVWINGVRVDDPLEVYERFSEWLTHAGYPPPKPTRRKRRKPKP